MASEEREPLIDQHRSARLETDTKRTRLIALLLLFLLSTGANWTEACLGPLKSTLVQDFNISNTQYGVISASTQLSNTILPIFAGLWIDRLGASRMAIVATLTVCIGAIIAAIACDSVNYFLLVLGRIIQGMGIIIVDTAATKLIVFWSKQAGWLGLAISCNFAFDRAAGAISKATAVPISQSGTLTNSSTTFWAAASISSVSFLASLLYYRFEQKHLSKRTILTTAATATESTLTSLAILRKTVTSLPMFLVFIMMTQFYQPIAVFNNLSADILRWRGSSQRTAGYLASIGQVTPIFVAPLLGGFFDRYGHRMEFVPLTAALLASSIGLLAWTNASPLVAMIIFSIGNALNTPPYLCSLAILLRDETTFGCSYSIWKVLMQGNQIIMNVTLGKLQDMTPGQGYQRVLLVLFISKLIELLWGFSYVFLDHLFARGILTADDKKRQRIEAILASNNNVNEYTLWRSCGLRANWLSSWIAIIYLSFVIVTAWALFFCILQFI